MAEVFCQGVVSFVFRIQKAPGYDEEDLSTIRTITERIK